MTEGTRQHGTPPSPSFTRPPLLEVALGVAFAPIANLGAVAMSDLARMWSGRYPRVQEHPPLPPTVAPGQSFSGSGMVVSVGAPQIRLWLLTENDDRLVQLQRDRLVVNWRSQPSSEGSYPRYADALRPEFEKDFEQFRDFLGGRGLAAPRPLTTEVTYVNSVEPSERADLVGLLRSQATTAHHLGAPVASALSQTWETARPGDIRSSVTVEADVALGQAAMVTLTGRCGVPEPAGMSEVLDSLDVCHDDVVASFVELTDEGRHHQWGRTS